MRRRLPSWLLAALLAMPLLGLSAWVVRGALGRSEGGGPGLPQPRADLPADRLEEHVDGAADGLRASGCRRLVAWRFETPPADAEALLFATAEGARAVLEREAGPGRTPGPGDEAQVSAQAVYFRRGPALVRLFLDPGASSPGSELVARAREIDRALVESGPW